MIFAVDGTQVAVALIGGLFGSIGLAITGWFGYRSIIARIKVENAGVNSNIDRVQTTVTNGISDAMRRLEVMVSDLRATQEISVAMDERPMFRTTPGGGLVWCNEAATQLLGMTLEALQEDGWAKAVHPEDATKVFTAWKESVRTKTPYGPQTYRYLHPHTGEVTWVKAVAQPVINNITNEITAWVATVVVIDDPL